MRRRAPSNATACSIASALESLDISGTRQINAIANMAYVDFPPAERNNADAPRDYLPTTRLTEEAPEAGGGTLTPPASVVPAEPAFCLQ